MAVPFQIQIGRISRFLSKWASTKGSSPVVTLGSEIVPVLEMWSGVENRYLDSWNKYSVDVQVAPVASVLAAVRVRNPIGSNVIAVFESIRTLTTLVGATDQPILSRGVGGGDLTAFVATGAFEDNRGQNNPMVLVSSGQSTSLVNIQRRLIHTTSLSADFVNTINQEVLLLPNSTIQVTSSVVNQQMDVTLVWRERALEESERQ